YGKDSTDTLQTVFGAPATLTVNNPLTLDPSSTTYDGGGLNIAATLTFPANSYTIQISDRYGNPLTTLSGTPVAGALTASWDGTAGNGNVIATGDLTAQFTLNAAGGASASARVVIIPHTCKCGKDITMLMYATLSDITTTFAAAPWYKQKLALVSFMAGY